MPYATPTVTLTPGTVIIWFPNIDVGGYRNIEEQGNEIRGALEVYGYADAAIYAARIDGPVPMDDGMAFRYHTSSTIAAEQVAGIIQDKYRREAQASTSRAQKVL